MLAYVWDENNTGLPYNLSTTELLFPPHEAECIAIGGGNDVFCQDAKVFFIGPSAEQNAIEWSVFLPTTYGGVEYLPKGMTAAIKECFKIK